MSNNVLEIKHLNKKYHNEKTEVVALDDISFSVKDKEFISIVGPSGCGKSTILGIIAGITKKSSGQIDFNVKKPVIGYMLQLDSLFPWRTVLENCILGLEIKKMLTKEKEKEVIRMLKTYGLEEFINSYPESLSGGMKQRVALIRTLAMNPDILLLDEPYSALDYQTRLALSDDLYSIIKKEGKTAIMVTHDIAEAISMSSRIIVITKRPGKIKKVVNINFPNKGKPTDNRKHKDFMNYYDMIWKEVDYHV